MQSTVCDAQTNLGANQVYRSWTFLIIEVTCAVRRIKFEDRTTFDNVISSHEIVVPTAAEFAFRIRYIRLHSSSGEIYTFYSLFTKRMIESGPKQKQTKKHRNDSCDQL